MGFIKDATRRFEGVNRGRAYLCPSPLNSRGDTAYDEDELRAWADGVVTDGKSYLRRQSAYEFIQDGMDIVNGVKEPNRVAALSDCHTDLVLRNLEEIVAAQTNIRIIPAFKCEIPEFRKQTSILNKRFMIWQGNTFADRSLRKGWQYACATGTGYIGTRYDPNYYSKGKGDIVLDAYGPLDVLPIGMGKQHDLQGAYAVALKVPTPVHKVWRLFPDQVDRIRPSRASRKERGTVVAAAVKMASAALKKFGPGSKLEDENMPWEMVDMYYIYVDDDSVNNTGVPIPMMGPDGVPGCSWCYTVPYVGQEIAPGKKARREDCLLYPNRRLIVATDDGIMNPDPLTQASYYWHGKVPIVQFRADDWAWNYLGFPLTRMGNSLEKSGNDLLRGMIDACNNRLNPTRMYNRNSSAASLMETLNPRIPGQVVGMDMDLINPDSIVRPILPVQFYEFPAYIPEVHTKMQQMLTHQMGVNDVAALARARQIPSGDSQAKLMEMMGPLTEDRSRNMEMSIRDLGELWKSMEFQFTSASKRFQMLGPEGITEEDMDYDPGTMIPMSDADFEAIDMKYDGKDGSWSKWNKTLAAQQFERARWHSGNIMFSVTPYSLHEINSITKKLFNLQLVQRGFPLDWWTQAEMFDIQNFGDPPMIDDPETGERRQALTVMERWVCQMEIMARMQQAQGGGQAKGKGGKGPHGRPPSGGTAPTLEQKSNGASTIRESKR